MPAKLTAQRGRPPHSEGTTGPASHRGDHAGLGGGAHSASSQRQAGCPRAVVAGTGQTPAGSVSAIVSFVSSFIPQMN